MEVVSIQYLRGLAALMIVFVHLEVSLRRQGYSGYWPHSLAAGVDIFFVISGFIMWITTVEGVTTLEFYRRRIIRIVPLYWLLTSVILAVLIVYPSAVQSGRFDKLHVLGSYLFFPVVHPVLGVMEPLLIPGWTLNYEMFFYALFGLALAAPPLLRLIALPAMLGGLISLRFLMHITPLTVAGFYTSDIMLEFVFGMALGWAYVRGLKISPAFAWALLLGGVCAMALVGDDSPLRGLSLGLPALCIVGSAVMIEQSIGVPNLRSLHLIGNASYSLYLSHPLALSLVDQVWRKSFLVSAPGTLIIFSCVAPVATVVMGVLMHLYVERPILRLARLPMFTSKNERALGAEARATGS